MAPRSIDRGRRREAKQGPGHIETREGGKSRGQAPVGPGDRLGSVGSCVQLPAVVVLATVAGVAAWAVAVVLTVERAVDIAVVATGAAVPAVAPLDAPDAMQAVRIAAAATPATPVTRRARCAGWGRRRPAGRGRALILVSISVFMGSSSAPKLGGSSEHAPLSRRLCRSSARRCQQVASAITPHATIPPLRATYHHSWLFMIPRCGGDRRCGTATESSR